MNTTENTSTVPTPSVSDKDSSRQRFATWVVMITLTAFLTAAVIILFAIFGSSYGYISGIDENGEPISYYHIGGKPYSGTKCIDNLIYAFDENGMRLSGKLEKDGTAYYFNTIPSQGFYLLRSTSIKIDGKSFYVNYYGILEAYPRTGFYNAPDGYRYYYNKSGVRVTAHWLEIDGNTYYFQPVTGRMLVSEKAVIDGITYVFDENGLATPITE